MNFSEYSSHPIPQDDPQRIEFKKSLWNKICHPFQIRQKDQTIQKAVVDYFQYQCHVSNPDDFKKTWSKIGIHLWTPEKQFTPDIAKRIEIELQNSLKHHEKGILNEINNENPLESTPNKIRGIVNTLLHGQPLPSLDRKILKAIFIKSDTDFMTTFQKELQNELTNLYLKKPESPKEELVWKAFLGNVISLLPFCYPEDGTKFSIPILTSEGCSLVEYTTKVLNLPFAPFSSPMKALELTTDNPKAPPLLSFLGTTFPAASGFVSTVLADFTPGYSVGEAVYQKNKKEIGDWVESHPGAHVFGMSLGGAMAFHTLLDHHDKLAEISVYNPPGLYEHKWKTGIGTSCQVNIYCQTGDIVSKLGTWPEGDNVNFYTVIPHQKGIKSGVLASHAKVFTGCERLTMIKRDPAAINRSLFKKVVTLFHQWVLSVCVFLPVSFTLLMYAVIKKTTSIGKECIHKINSTFKK